MKIEAEYKTLKNMEFSEAMQFVLTGYENNFSPETEDIDNFLDNLMICFKIMFPYYHKKKVREEESKLRKQFIKNHKTFTCAKCKRKFQASEIHLHHKTPVCKYGGNEKENIVLLCKKCHVELHKSLGLNTEDEEY